MDVDGIAPPVLIAVHVDIAPDNDEAFAAWCEKQGFNVLNSGRRAWCSEFSSYFRDAAGVATTRNGERFLFYEDDVEKGGATQ